MSAKLVSFTYALRGAILAASVALCSGTVGPVEAATTPLGHSQPSHQTLSTLGAPPKSDTIDAAASTGDVIISAGNVYVYSNTLHLVAQINATTFTNPQGLALDAAGNLYIANTGTAGIPVYKNDYQTQVATLNDPYPSVSVAVAPNGVVGVLDHPSKYSNSHVTFFASGSTTPCASLSLPRLTNLSQGAFDAAGNLYVTGQAPRFVPTVGVIRGGCSAKGIELLSIANHLGSVFGIQVTRFGKIAVEDGLFNVIYTYNPPAHGILGTPITTTGLEDVGYALQFGFSANGAFHFAAGDVPNGGLKYAYPAGGPPLQTFGKNQVPQYAIGLVVAPPAQP